MKISPCGTIFATHSTRKLLKTYNLFVESEQKTWNLGGGIPPRIESSTPPFCLWIFHRRNRGRDPIPLCYVAPLFSAVTYCGTGIPLAGCGKSVNLRRKWKDQARQGLKPTLILRHLRHDLKSCPVTKQPEQRVFPQPARDRSRCARPSSTIRPCNEHP